MRPSPALRARFASRLALAALTLLLAACETTAPPKPIAGQFGGGSSPAAYGLRVVVLSVDDFPSTSTPGADDGPQQSLAGILARFAASPPPMDASTLAAWQGCGLRVLSVPRAEVEPLRRALNIVGPTEDRWLGQTPPWVPVAHSPQIVRSLTLRMDNGPVSVNAGELRLLLRGWVAPLLSAQSNRAVMQLDMVPDFKPAQAPSQSLLDPRETPPDDSPVPFWRLQLHAALTGEVALLVVPEEPDVQWSRRPDQTGDQSADQPPDRSSEPGSNSSELLSPGASAKPPLGPAAPPAPTLGELLLNRATLGGRRTRTMLLITADVPAQCRLLP